MFNIALYEPEIPPNTGNIIRLCANTGCDLHLIHPLGFSVNDKTLRRAGMDYINPTFIHHHIDYHAFVATLRSPRLFALSTKGTTPYHRAHFDRGDVFLFGPESRGLPTTLLDCLPSEHTLRIPMAPNSRSINLSNAVSIVLYEALRQLGYDHLR